MQSRSAALQPPLHRSRRPAQLPGRFLYAAVFQAAQNDRQPIRLRQTAQFFINNPEQFARGEISQRIGARVDDRYNEMPGGAELASLCRPRPERHAARNDVQPCRQRVSRAHAGGFAGQYQERGLNGSSASWMSPRTRRHTCSTSGAWQSTSAAKALSSLAEMKRLSRAASVVSSD